MVQPAGVAGEHVAQVRRAVLEHGQAVAAYGLKLVRARTIRFTISLWLSGTAYLFIFTQVVLSLIWSPS